MEPNTAKHSANAPVPRTSWKLAEDLSCIGALPLLRPGATTLKRSLTVHCRRFYDKRQPDAVRMTCLTSGCVAFFAARVTGPAPSRWHGGTECCSPNECADGDRPRIQRVSCRASDS